MKCQILFSGENKKNISISHSKILPRVLSIKLMDEGFSINTDFSTVLRRSFGPI